jgi:hypothetical protein
LEFSVPSWFSGSLEESGGKVRTWRVIILNKFDVEKDKRVLTYKELAEALGLKPKNAKKILVSDG